MTRLRWIRGFSGQIIVSDLSEVRISDLTCLPLFFFTFSGDGMSSIAFVFVFIFAFLGWRVNFSAQKPSWDKHRLLVGSLFLTSVRSE